jgi:hypothetical protein
MANDILLGEDNDLMFRNGDFVIGESEEQEIKMIMQAVKNDYKQTPELGVNLVEHIESSGSSLRLRQIIKLNLRMDNKNNRFSIKNWKIEFYERN